MNDHEFIEICKKSSSMSEAARVINIPFTSFIRKAKRLGCYSPNQGWSRGKVSVIDNRISSKYKSDEIFCENSQVSRSRIKKLLISLSLAEYVCGICNMDPIWNGKSLSLHIDHINGIRNDNRLENLRFLCPNCHSQTETYCTLNKDSKKISSFQIEDIIEIIKESKTLTSVIRKLGVLDTEVNRIRILKMMEQNFLSFPNDDFSSEDKEISKKHTKCERCSNIKPLNKCKYCPKCSSFLQRKVERPNLGDLVKDVQELGYSATGRKYGVSDNAIRKWLKIKEMNH